MKLGNAVRRTSAALAVGALSLGLVTVTGGTAQAAASCTGDVSIYGTLSDGRLTYAQVEPDTGDLTGQQATALRLPAEGHTDETIAKRLGVSHRTARRIASELMDRLGARSRFEAGVRAVQQGWLPPPLLAM